MDLYPVPMCQGCCCFYSMHAFLKLVVHFKKHWLLCAAAMPTTMGRILIHIILKLCFNKDQIYCCFMYSSIFTDMKITCGVNLL